ncbi:MAG: tetraacyldisaccharide 4'-kinase [Sulfurovum sp.]
MNKKLHLWIEEYLFFPTPLQQLISFLVLPLTFIYMLFIFIKRAKAKEIDFNIPIISVGNIIVGGSGKTPVTIKLAQNYHKPCVVLRGYARKSKGLYVISNEGKVLEDISISGDEAMLLAKSLPNATIIVSEDRRKAIVKARELGCKIVFLDDGFSKYDIKKFNILLRPKKEPTNIFCLPSGGYREPKGFYMHADIELKEGEDFNRVITFKQNNKVITTLPEKLVLLTAISKPTRLMEFLSKDTILESFPDHYDFTNEDIKALKSKYSNYTFITTGKDLVKLDKYNLKDIILMDLDIEFTNSVEFYILDEYLKDFNK